MADNDGGNKLFSVEKPLMLHLEEEITDLENEFRTKLRQFEGKWNLQVSHISYDGDEVTVRCEIGSSRKRR